MVVANAAQNAKQKKSKMVVATVEMLRKQLKRPTMVVANESREGLKHHTMNVAILRNKKKRQWSTRSQRDDHYGDNPRLSTSSTYIEIDGLK